MEGNTGAVKGPDPRPGVPMTCHGCASRCSIRGQHGADALSDAFSRQVAELRLLSPESELPPRATRLRAISLSAIGEQRKGSSLRMPGATKPQAVTRVEGGVPGAVGTAR